MNSAAQNPEVFPLAGGDSYTWRPLRMFNLYRLLLSCLFFVLFLLGPIPNVLGSHNPLLFHVVSLLFVLSSVLGGFSIRQRTPSFNVQTNTLVTVDIFAIALLMHASGGITSGLGILLVITIASGSILMVGRLAILYAAIASLVILAEQVFSQLSGVFASTAYTQAGLLGTSFFATSLASQILAKRLRESEALARQRGVDLANMERLNEHIIHQMQSGILVVDADNRIRLANEAGRRLLGVMHIADRQQLDNLSLPLQQQLEQWRRHPKSHGQIFQSVGGEFSVYPHFTPLGEKPESGTLILLEDSTEATQRLQQLKLASLGRLTASIAHEIRNPLGAISHATQLLAESQQLETGDQRLTQIIEEQSRRMNRIVENVLQLSRRETTHPETIQLQDWLEHFLLEFCGISQVDRERIDVRIEPANMMVSIDPQHLHQIVWNLCQNGVRYSRKKKSERLLNLYGGVQEVNQIPFLDICDFGPGISDENTQTIFEPFFTTETSGTGLGLYIARELCEFNGARLSLNSEATEGASFRISFAHQPSLPLEP